MEKNELVKLLYENFYNKENNLINLNDLDFTDYNCNVAIANMKVPGTLFQNHQNVKEDLFQSFQKVERYLHQNRQLVKGNLYQDFQKVEGILLQGHQIVGGDLFQKSQEVQGDLFQGLQIVGGNLYQRRQKVKGKVFCDNKTNNAKIDKLKKANREIK